MYIKKVVSTTGPIFLPLSLLKSAEKGILRFNFQENDATIMP